MQRSLLPPPVGKVSLKEPWKGSFPSFLQESEKTVPIWSFTASSLLPPQRPYNCKLSCLFLRSHTIRSLLQFLLICQVLTWVFRPVIPCPDVLGRSGFPRAATQPCSPHAHPSDVVLLRSAIYHLSPAINSSILDRSPSKFSQHFCCAHRYKKFKNIGFLSCSSGCLSALDSVKDSLLKDLNTAEIASQYLFGLLYFVFLAVLPTFIKLPKLFFMYDLLGAASFPLRAFPTHCFITLACFGVLSG